MAEAMESTSLTLSVPAEQIQPKPIHTIVLDSSPLLLNTPSLSTLLSQSHSLVTTKTVISEIRDEEARSRIETLYMPFLTIQTPKLQSIMFVREFARKTGDVGVLSAADLEILALAYELECERNVGDWRLRRAPGQKRVNGSKPVFATEGFEAVDEEKSGNGEDTGLENITEGLQGAVLQEDVKKRAPPVEEGPEPQVAEEPVLPDQDDASGSDSEGWITPSNIKKHQAIDMNAEQYSKKGPAKTLQVATITGDFAMQNVLLQINLNLLSPKTCKQIKQLKQTLLRCHGCFNTTRIMDKQFCPRCGKPTLTRVSCTTNDKGEVKMHLKANMQWNNKGNVFSIPKPVCGRSNQKWTGSRDGGGKSGWGTDLMLAEDQKEYVAAMTVGRRQRSKKEKDLMDEDYLPSILTGERSGGNGRIRVGGGRHINAKKR
jgi:RNA-binding protein NOB1